MTEHDLADLQDIIRMMLREFDTTGQWPSVDVLVNNEWHTATVSIELGELLLQAEDMVNEYED
jgi:hypothetical protein